MLHYTLERLARRAVAWHGCVRAIAARTHLLFKIPDHTTKGSLTREQHNSQLPACLPARLVTNNKIKRQKNSQKVSKKELAESALLFTSGSKAQVGRQAGVSFIFDYNNKIKKLKVDAVLLVVPDLRQVWNAGELDHGWRSAHKGDGVGRRLRKVRRAHGLGDEALVCGVEFGSVRY